MSGKYNRAFIVGKFLPPHKGHKLMIEMALEVAESVVVCVERQKKEAIDVKVRRGWLEEEINNERADIKIIDIQPQNAMDCGGEDYFWRHWSEVIKENAPGADLIVSGDGYGERLARDVGADWIRVDRDISGMSATKWKENPWDEFSNLITPARLGMQKRILLIGPESTGKSVAGKIVSEKLGIGFVEEFAKSWIESNQDKKIDERALGIFLEGQSGLGKIIGRSSGGVIIEDSNALSTGIWAEYFGFEKMSEKCFEMAKRQKPSEIFLFSKDNTEFIKDVHRVDEGSRDYFEKRCEEIMNSWGWGYEVIDCEVNKRPEVLEKNILKYINKWKVDGWEKWARGLGDVKPKAKTMRI